MQIKADIVEDAFAVEVFDFENNVSDLGRLLRVDLCHFPADHHFDDLLDIRFRRGHGLDMLAVADDGNVVRHAEDFLHLVADVDHCNALVAQLIDLLDQELDLVGGQRRRRLVHQDDARVCRDCLDDLEHLRFRDGQVLHLFRQIEGKSLLVKILLCLFTHGLHVHGHRVFHDLAAEIHVFKHGHFGNDVQLLVDHRNTGLERIRRAVGVQRLALEQNPAFVRLVKTVDDLQQRGLACAVFADQNMHRPFFDAEIDVVQRANAGEHLRHMLKLEDVVVLCRIVFFFQKRSPPYFDSKFYP